MAYSAQRFSTVTVKCCVCMQPIVMSIPDLTRCTPKERPADVLLDILEHYKNEYDICLINSDKKLYHLSCLKNKSAAVSFYLFLLLFISSSENLVATTTTLSQQNELRHFQISSQKILAIVHKIKVYLYGEVETVSNLDIEACVEIVRLLENKILTTNNRNIRADILVVSLNTPLGNAITTSGESCTNILNLREKYYSEFKRQIQKLFSEDMGTTLPENLLLYVLPFNGFERAESSTLLNMLIKSKSPSALNVDLQFGLKKAESLARDSQNSTHSSAAVKNLLTETIYIQNLLSAIISSDKVVFLPDNIANALTGLHTFSGLGTSLIDAVNHFARSQESIQTTGKLRNFFHTIKINEQNKHLSPPQQVVALLESLGKIPGLLPTESEAEDYSEKLTNSLTGVSASSTRAQLMMVARKINDLLLSPQTRIDIKIDDTIEMLLEKINTALQKAAASLSPANPRSPTPPQMFVPPGGESSTDSHQTRRDSITSVSSKLSSNTNNPEEPLLRQPNGRMSNQNESNKYRRLFYITFLFLLLALVFIIYVVLTIYGIAPPIPRIHF